LLKFTTLPEVVKVDVFTVEFNVADILKTIKEDDHQYFNNALLQIKEVYIFFLIYQHLFFIHLSQEVSKDWTNKTEFGFNDTVITVRNLKEGTKYSFRALIVEVDGSFSIGDLPDGEFTTKDCKSNSILLN